MGRKTSLYGAHREAGAKMVDFGGWEMPLHYGSQMEEHHQVRRDAGMFDVSHMTVVDVHGARSEDFLRKLLANDVAKLTTPGRALYSCMLNQRGGVIDDLIVYFLADDRYRMVVNAATREKDLAWIRERGRDFEVSIEERPDLAMIAIQGPKARGKTLRVLPESIRESVQALASFFALESETYFVARTGYTGEDGFEVMVPDDKADEFWRALLDVGVSPIGLGARDTLRLEAGMNLYGADMDEETTPLESGLAWTVAWKPQDRDFVGREAVEAQRAAGPSRRLAGLVLQGRGVLRAHQKVITDVGEGETTSGGYSPTLGVSIALARIPASCGQTCEVEIRGKRLAARIVKPPFVRNGQSCLGD